LKIISVRSATSDTSLVQGYMVNVHRSPKCSYHIGNRGGRIQRRCQNFYGKLGNRFLRMRSINLAKNSRNNWCTLVRPSSFNKSQLPPSLVVIIVIIAIINLFLLKLLRSTDLFCRDLKTFLFHSVYGHQDTD